MSRRVISILPLAAALLVSPSIGLAEDDSGPETLDEGASDESDADPEAERAGEDAGGDGADEADAPVASAADEDADQGEPAPLREPRDGPPWKLGKPGLEPAVGAVLFPSGTGGITALVGLGGEASLPFYQETNETLRWGGRARVVGQVLLGPDLYNGYAARVGVFAGPSAGPARLRVGPDFFVNQYLLSGADPDPFSGVGLPLTLSLGGDNAGIYGGVEPAWYMSGGWPGVDWGSEDIFGFGDEFSYRVGANVSTSSLGLALGYTHRITSFGVQRGVAVGFGL